MFGIEKLTDAIEELTLQVMALRVDIRTLRQEAAPVPAQAKVDPAEELRNRRFSEGLENLMSFDGRPQKGDEADGE